MSSESTESAESSSQTKTDTVVGKCLVRLATVDLIATVRHLILRCKVGCG